MNEFVAIKPTSIISRSTAQMSAELGGETAILALADGTYYGLTEVGALIWRMLEQPVSVAAIVEAIVSTYDVPPDLAERDLLALLTELRVKQLIRIDE